MRSGFATVIGRPNVGKSSLVNAMVGTKVSITASRPNTTRNAVRGVLHRGDSQIVFVDTPGLHRPKTRLGHRLNETADGALNHVDVVLVVVEAPERIGPGDTMALRRAFAALHRATRTDSNNDPSPSEGVAVVLDYEGMSIEELLADGDKDDDVDEWGSGPRRLFVVVNKIDRAGPERTAQRLLEVSARCDELASEFGVSSESLDFFAVCAINDKGVAHLIDALFDQLEEGPPYFPQGMVTDTPQSVWIAELVREQLVRRMRDELPHAIAVRVVEWEGDYIRCEILVERDSQKGMVIGKGGQVLKEVGIAVRKALPESTYLDLNVVVERDWQGRSDALDALGY